jgi:enoyl-CoA hydratase
MSDVRFEVTGRVARITLDRPARGNALTRRLVAELERTVERADLDPRVHVLLLSGNGKGFCGGYDLIEYAEGHAAGGEPAQGNGGDGAAWPDSAPQPPGDPAAPPPGSPLDPYVIMANHDPSQAWDPMVDYAMMSRNVRAFMSLFHCSKPVICKVHGFCVAGGTDLALCSDLLLIADDAKIGYPPARVWGSPTTSLWAYRLGAQRAKRLLFTGDCLSGAEALEWGLAVEAPSADQLDARTEALVARIACMPVNQLQMMKLLVNQSLYSQGLHAAQTLGTIFDGVARHTSEGYAFQSLAAGEGFRAAVRERDQPFATDPARHPGSPDGVVAKPSGCDLGPSTFKG